LCHWQIGQSQLEIVVCPESQDVNQEHSFGIPQALTIESLDMSIKAEEYEWDSTNAEVQRHVTEAYDNGDLGHIQSGHVRHGYSPFLG